MNSLAVALVVFASPLAVVAVSLLVNRLHRRAMVLEEEHQGAKAVSVLAGESKVCFWLADIAMNVAKKPDCCCMNV